MSYKSEKGFSLVRKMSSMLEDDSIIEKLVTESGAANISKCKFIYGAGMHKQWMENSSIFLDFVGSW